MTGPEYTAARIATGLDQRQLAKKLGIGFRSVQRYEAEGCPVWMDWAMKGWKAEGKTMTDEVKHEPQSAIATLIQLAPSGHRKYTCYGVEIDGADFGDWVVDVRNTSHTCIDQAMADRATQWSAIATAFKPL